MVREAVDRGLLIKGGGHAMAAGITVERSRLGELRAFFEEHAGETVFELRDAESLKIDAAVSADGATLTLAEELERAGPFGPGHPQPMLALPRHRIADVRTVGNGGHLRVELRSEAGGRIAAMAFRAAETDLGAFLAANRGQLVHVAGTLSINYWNGSSSPQLRIVDAARAD